MLQKPHRPSGILKGFYIGIPNTQTQSIADFFVREKVALAQAKQQCI
jgi:hypothetical protein